MQGRNIPHEKLSEPRHQFPESWKLMRLGEFASVKGRIGWRGLMKSEYTNDGPLMLSVWSLVDNQQYGIDYNAGVNRLSMSRYEESPEIKLKSGDVIVAKDGDIGRIGYVKNLPGPTTVNSHVVVVRTFNDLVDSEYLFWYFKSKPFQQFCKAHTSGTTVPLLSQKYLKQALIPIPSIIEQHQVSSVLSMVDELIQKTEQIIQRTHSLKKGLIQTIFTKGIAHKELKKVSLYLGTYDEIPQDWSVCALDDVCDIKGGKRLPLGDKLSDYKTPYPYIRIVDFSDGTIDTTNIKYLTEETYKKIRNYTISSDDVYISIAGIYLGKAGVIPTEINGANLTENAAKLCNLRLVINEFLAQLLNSPICQRQIKSLTGVSSQPKLALYRLQKIKIVIPEIGEQKAIVKIISNISNYTRFWTECKHEIINLKKGLMQNLLTGKIRVKV